MIKIITLSLVWWLQTSIYSYKVPGIDGNMIDFNDFRNKKILLVNIATQSSYATQLQKLQQLHNLYKDSLVIIAFPSNSFNHEPGTNATIATVCRTQYDVHYLIAEKANVSGTDMQPVYKWLTTFSENGVMDGTILGDFEKLLLDKHGKLAGIFAPSVDPMSPQLINAIKE